MYENLKINENYLITTLNWFVAPDGEEYRAIFGKVAGILTDEETLGVKTNRGSTNWYVSIGNMMVAGCQANYAIKTDKVNPGNSKYNWAADTEHGLKIHEAPTRIYNANEDYK